jgi:hypothetical protein
MQYYSTKAHPSAKMLAVAIASDITITICGTTASISDGKKFE